VDGAGLCVECARDCYFLSGESFRTLLVTERERVLAVVENIRGAMCAVASESALGVIRAHPHSRVISSGAHVVSDGAGERALALRGGDGCNKEKRKDERFHWCVSLFNVSCELTRGTCQLTFDIRKNLAARRHQMSRRRSGAHDPYPALGT